MSRVMRCFWGGCWAVVAFALPAGAQITVGEHVHVSRGLDTLLHDDPLVDAHPTDPAILIACSVARTPGNTDIERTVGYASTDSGRSWNPTVTDSGPGSYQAGCAFGPNNSAFFVAHSIRSQPDLFRVYRSADAGLTWSEPVRIQPTNFRPHVVVDRTSGRYQGNVYIAWGNNAIPSTDGATRPGLALVTSTDGGATFGKPTFMAYAPNTLGGRPSGMAVLSDGTLLVLVDEVYIKNEPRGRRSDTQTRQKVVVVTSTDGGETFSAGVVLADASPGEGMPSLAADISNGPFRDRIYVAWADDRHGLDRRQIYIASSDDRGRSWSRPRIVNDERAWRPRPNGARGPNHGVRALAVSREGIVGLLWYAGSNDPSDKTYRVRFTASLDGGDTWLPSVAVTETPNSRGVITSDERWGFSFTSTDGDSTTKSPIEVKLRQGGDAAHVVGLTADADGTFHALWEDDRTGRAQLWTAPIDVSGIVIPNGSAELAHYEDVSPKVILEVKYASEDRENGTLVAEVKLTNASTDTLRGPLKVRVLTLSSDLAVVSIASSDNGLTGEGAVWDLLPPTGTLLPGASTDIRPVVFRITNVWPSIKTGTFDGDAVSFTARVLAPRHDSN